jgi:hypothetical protein
MRCMRDHVLLLSLRVRVRSGSRKLARWRHLIYFVFVFVLRFAFAA